MDGFYYNETKRWDHEYIAADSVPSCHSEGFAPFYLARDYCYYNVVNELHRVFPSDDIVATFIARYAHMHKFYETICECHPSLAVDARLIAMCCYADSRRCHPKYYNPKKTQEITIDFKKLNLGDHQSD